MHWYIAVPQSGQENFHRALNQTIWGSKERRQFEDGRGSRIGDGDVVHFIVAARWDGEGAVPKGFPRVQLDQFRIQAEEFVAQVDGDLFESTDPIRDDDVYPIRFHFAQARRTEGFRLNAASTPDSVRDAVRRSMISQGRAMPLNEEITEEHTLSTILASVMEQYREASRGQFPRHLVADLVTHQIPQVIQRVASLTNAAYTVRGSVGQGNWAAVPWVSIIDNERGGTVQNGLYIALLFAEAMDTVVLALMFGVSQQDASGLTLTDRVADLRERLSRSAWRADNDVHLAARGVGAKYPDGIVIYRAYRRDALPSDDAWSRDFADLLGFYEQALDEIAPRGKAYEVVPPPRSSVAREPSPDGYQRTAPFDLRAAHQRALASGYVIAIEDLFHVILALQVRPFVIFAGKSGTGKTALSRIVAGLFGFSYEKVAVSPAWADPADLLGYVSPIHQRRVDGALSRILTSGDEDTLLCLDEFNVAKVEHYFSDFISAMDGGGRGTSFWGEIASLSRLAIDEPALAIPSGLMVIATMNYDDSVQSITPRVLDRANLIEFDIRSAEAVVTRGQLEWSSLENEAPFNWPWGSTATAEDPETEERIRRVWVALQKSRGQFGHRAAQEMHRYVALGLPFADAVGREQATFRDALIDRQLVQRVLPKFHGTGLRRDIDGLIQVLAALSEDHDELVDVNDWHRVLDEALNRGRYPKTAEKVAQLVQSHTEDGYASFW